MKLTLKQDEFEHDVELSKYNNNYYRHKKELYVIFEQCHEDFNYNSFYLFENTQMIFLGCSQEGFGHGDVVNIDFRIEYT